MAGLAEDLKIAGFIRSTKGEGYDVINVPAFARGDFKRALGAVAIGAQEVVEALLCRKGFAFSHRGPREEAVGMCEDLQQALPCASQRCVPIAGALVEGEEQGAR